MPEAYDDLRQSGVRVGLVARGALLVLCSSLAAAKGSVEDLLWLAVLLPAALAMSRPWRSRTTCLLALTFESSACGLTILATGSETSVFLPYLLALAFSGAMVLEVTGALVPPGVAILTLLVGRFVRGTATPLREFSANVALWAVLSGFVGLVTAWICHLALSAGQSDPEGVQRTAYDLLSRLRTVARRLPGTLDPTSTAEALLISVRAVAPYTEGAVLVSSVGSRLVPLARTGSERPDWDLALTGDTLIADAWATQAPHPSDRRLPRTDGTRPPGSSLVVPLSLGLRTLGLLVLESDRQRVWSRTAVRQIATAANQIAMQLETGLLFDEVRTLATTEERKRVAREIHDGIAQELVFLGYSLDNVIMAAAGDGESSSLGEHLCDLRSEVTRLVSDLRFSLFDLRSDIDVNSGLGTALSEHARLVGTQTGLTVNLSLTESSLRLPSSTEVELLRIAQEAIANVRKHARAANLWVTCCVEPPHASITVEDDGVGIRENRRTGSLGLTIMRERAQRIRAELSVAARPLGGTRVDIRLGIVPELPRPHDEEADWEVARDANDRAPR